MHARHLLRNYDGTWSVDVEELFDERNLCDLLGDIIEIGDDDEWDLMPAQIDSVRSARHCAVLENGPI